MLQSVRTVWTNTYNQYHGSHKMLPVFDQPQKHLLRSLGQDLELPFKRPPALT